jgi:hypothetical protein
MNVTKNFSCPKCSPVSRDQLPTLMEELNEVLFNYGVTQGLCGSSVNAATLLGCMMVHKRTQIMDPTSVQHSLSDLLLELEQMADELIKVERKGAGL